MFRYIWDRMGFLWYLRLSVFFGVLFLMVVMFVEDDDKDEKKFEFNVLRFIFFVVENL